MLIQPYLCFEGRCEEAIDFYKQALGAEVEMLMRFKEMPQDGENSQGCGGEEGASSGDFDGEKIMHACLRIGETQVLFSDGRCQGPAKFTGIALSISVTDKTEAERLFNALADGGAVQMPLAETFFSPSFGMVSDRFGVSWIVVMEHQAASTRN